MSFGARDCNDDAAELRAVPPFVVCDTLGEETATVDLPMRWFRVAASFL